jgi:gliding motility-associated-like protein
MLFIKFKNFLFFLLVVAISNIGWSQITITATGNQVYCPQSPINIVTNFTIADASNSIDALYVQISEGYVQGEDSLTLIGIHPNITYLWDTPTGKLTLNWINSSPVNYNELITAVEQVEFESTSLNPSDKSFSITISDANYLPSTGHFYQFIKAIGITWTDAKIAAENLDYYELQGYLATITIPEEAQLSGEQAGGAGWIGGSDADSEGTWKWVTGPENGTVFWNGGVNGNSPNFANWNSNEPNNLGNEDYAHVTAPDVGNSGSWNDLSNTGATSGDYQPKGFIVEYGGMTGDPTVSLSASTKITVPKIISTSAGEACGSDEITLSASANVGNVLWFNSQTETTALWIGENYTTPILNTTTTYYVLASENGCLTGNRTSVTATINQIPTIANVLENSICESGSGALSATASSGEINWYSNATGGSSLFTGENFETPFISETTTFYVDATSTNCTSITRTPITLTVYNTTFPIVVDLAVNDLTIIENSVNNSIAFNVQNSSFEVDNYEYALDNEQGDFQDELFFENIIPGIHTIFIRDKSNCGLANLKVAILGFPNFFTPNNDGANDTWNIVGLDNDKYQISVITIFNRFGTVLAIIDSKNNGWDGIYNGEKLPASDYWFKVDLINQNGTIHEKIGHFSLIR